MMVWKLGGAIHDLPRDGKRREIPGHALRFDKTSWGFTKSELCMFQSEFENGHVAQIDSVGFINGLPSKR